MNELNRMRAPQSLRYPRNQQSSALDKGNTELVPVNVVVVREECRGEEQR